MVFLLGKNNKCIQVIVALFRVVVKWHNLCFYQGNYQYGKYFEIAFCRKVFP